MSWMALMAVIATTSLMGRPFRTPQPEELFAIADVVVNGRVTDITVTEKRSEITLGSNQPVKVKLAEARIEPLKVGKGDLAGTLLVEFPVLDPDGGGIINGPMLPQLMQGERFRLYLKREGDRFVTALHDDFDSGFAVQHLAADESDDSPPLFKEEAEKIALQEFRRFRPGPDIREITGSFDGSGWKFAFFTSNPLTNPAFTSDAEIVVDGSRLIDSWSFIGSQAPRAGSSLSESDLGQPVRITVEGHFQNDGSFASNPGEITILYGRIERIQNRSVFGAFLSPAFRNAETRKLSFPQGKLASIQSLAVSPAPAK
ncbi:hypothetical protein DB345_02075 [Spartobacteria bacterium LR76]|nr:hypothetical protein DB345_02075 [Spartobacteria bacterium LR76]